MSDEALNRVAKTMVTETVSKKIDADVKPGRARSDVIRDALEFYFEHRDRLLRGSTPGYGAKPKKKP